MSSKKKIVHPLATEDREKLFKFARKWQDLLSLHRWRISPSTLPTKNMAEVRFHKDSENKLASLLVGGDFGSTPVDDESLEMTALHEVLHIFLHEFKEACREHPYNESILMEAEHGLVHVLEKLLYELWHQNHAELPEAVPADRPKNKRAKPH